MSYYFKPVRNTSLTSKHLQYPIRAFFYFYGRSACDACCMALCQCPIRAFFYFYGIYRRKGTPAACRCQCPIRAFFYFYLHRFCTDFCHQVSMPYTGLFQFLRISKYGLMETWRSVSMPYTGLFQFLLWVCGTIRSTPPVSMPYTGLFQFLLCSSTLDSGSLRMCQCPIRAFFNFYKQILRPGSNHRAGVNALYGPFSISTSISSLRQWRKEKCQCPIRAFFNFYRRIQVLWTCMDGVSMPYTGLFQFLRSPPKNGLFPLFFRGVFTRN